MLHLIVLNLLKKDRGFTLFELIVILVIISIVSAISLPSLIGSQRQDKVNEAFSKIQGGLRQVQLNANRKSTTCTITIDISEVIASPSGCLLENITFDSGIVDITSTTGILPQDIAFTYRGTTSNSQTLQIRRKTFSGEAMPETGKCIVISTIGMIRTGIYNGNVKGTNCNNIENKRYDNANP
jgi:prepilin-type N-terminal cleavage/methylation domain-containing protein